MEQGDGQRRRDARDSGGYVVYSPYRQDPNVEPHVGWYVVMGIIVIVTLFAIVHCAMPTIQTIFVSLPDVPWLPVPLP